MAGEKKQLREFKASGENSSVMDPVQTGSTSRAKDNGGKQDPMSMTAVPGAGDKEDMIETKPKAKNNKRSADKMGGEKSTKLKEMVSALIRLSEEDLDELHSNLVGEDDEEISVVDIVKEDFESLFSESEFSEEFKNKAFTIFEAAVLARVLEEREQLEEEYNEALEETISALSEEIEEKVDDYLTNMVEQWAEDNELAIETSIRNDLSESFMDGLRELMIEHYIDIPEEKEDVLEGLIEQYEDLVNQYNELYAENNELTNIIESTVVSEVVDSMSEGLSESQKEKFLNIAEELSFDSVEDLEEKLNVIRESTFKVKPNTKAEQMLNEEYNNGDSTAPVISGRMSEYLAASSRTAKK